MIVAAFAACGTGSGDGPSGGGSSTEKPIELEYVLSKDGSGYEVSGIGTVTDPNINVPAEYEGKPVVGVCSGAFSGNSLIETISLPDSVKTVGSSSFSDCSSLREITMDGVE